MPTSKDWLLPKPADWQAFQRMSVDVLQERMRPLAPAQEFGRNGQKQSGIDILLQLRSGLHGYQCKCTEKLTSRTVRDEVAKAEKFSPDLHAYTILTTADLDTPLQLEVMQLSTARTAEGKFKVDVVFWPTFHRWLADYPRVRKVHYPEIYADAQDLVCAAARRLESEFPGSSVAFHGTSAGVNVIVQPGPGGIPCELSLTTEEARAKVELSARSGDPFTLGRGEFLFRVPPAVADLLPDGATLDTLTAQPQWNGTVVDATLVIHSRTRHHDFQTFSRRARTASDGFAARLTINRFGTDRMVLALRMSSLPLTIAMEHSTLFGERRSEMEVRRHYADTEPAQRLLLAERLLLAVDSDAYFAIVVGCNIMLAGELHRSGMGNLAFTEALEIFVELAELTGWEILVPRRFTEADVDEARSLVRLLRSGRRLLSSSGCTFRYSVTTQDGMENLRALAQHLTSPSTADVQSSGGQVTVLDQQFVLPPTVLRLSGVEFPPDLRSAVLSQTELPIRVTLTSTGEVYEELAKVGG